MRKAAILNLKIINFRYIEFLGYFLLKLGKNSSRVHMTKLFIKSF